MVWYGWKGKASPHGTIFTNEYLQVNSCPLQNLNLTPEEQKAIKELQDDNSWVVVIAENGVAMVVMDREDYTDKALSLLAGSNTYNIVTKDPTTKLKNKLAKTLRDIKNQGWLSDHSYRKVYPHQCSCPQILWPSQHTQSLHPP